jgi:hypothetical protein
METFASITQDRLVDSLVYREINFYDLSQTELVEALEGLITYRYDYDLCWDVDNIISDIKRRLKSNQ